MANDFYMKHQNNVARLVAEWEKYGKIVIAYDFDNTVFDYHKQGHTYEDVVELLRECHEAGSYLMVFTAKTPGEYPEVKEYLNKNNIPFDSVNQEAPFIKFGAYKPYFNILLDDRAGLESAYRTLKDSVYLYKVRKETMAKLAAEKPSDPTVQEQLEEALSQYRKVKGANS